MISLESSKPNKKQEVNSVQQVLATLVLVVLVRDRN